MYAHKLYRKAASVGLEPDVDADGFATMADALARLRVSTGAGETETALGDLLAGAVVVARANGVDGETSLRGWAGRFRDRFVRMEAQAAEEGVELTAATADRARAIWVQVGLDRPSV